jgi:membrane protease YdiL (CAAX protease family)
LLALANVVNNRWLPSGYMASCAATSAALLAHARARGLGWGELGLAQATWRRGLGWASTAAAAVAGGYAVAAAAPATRIAFHDDRASAGIGAAARQALLPVLFGTVLLEEIGFRSVLWGQLRRRYGPVGATAGTSILFGLWHVLPSASLARHNRAVARALGASPRPITALVLASVGFTAVSGVLFAELRRRSDSLFAPAGLHWAANGLGYVTASLVRARWSAPAESARPESDHDRRPQG